MNDKTDSGRTDTDAVELVEDELDTVTGGWSWGLSQSGNVKNVKSGNIERGGAWTIEEGSVAERKFATEEIKREG